MAMDQAMIPLADIDDANAIRCAEAHARVGEIVRSSDRTVARIIDVADAMRATGLDRRCPRLAAAIERRCEAEIGRATQALLDAEQQERDEAEMQLASWRY